MAVRRVQMATSGKSDVPLPPAPPPHPGYAPNAALHAIKRHALEFVSPKAAAVSLLLFSLLFLCENCFKKAKLLQEATLFLIIFTDLK